MKVYLFILLTSLFLVQACKEETIIEPPPQVEEDFWEPVNSPKETIREIKGCSNGFLFANTPYGVLRSTDDGNNWNYCLTRMNMDWEIGISNNDRIAVVSYGSIFISSDYGDNWDVKLLTTDTLNFFPFTHDLTFDNEERIFIAADLGVLRSTDLGDTWSLLTEGMFIKNIRSVLVTNDNSKVIAGANSSLNALYYSTNKGDNWSENTNLTHQIIFSLAEDSSGNLYAAGYGALFFSRDQGISWDTIATVNSYFSNVLFANKKIYVTIAGGNVFYSDDGGLNYKELNSGFKESKGICLYPSNDGYLFAGTNFDGIYKSKKSVY